MRLTCNALSPWLTLAVTGTIVVLLSSCFEKDAFRFVERFVALKARVDSWSLEQDRSA